MKTYFSVNEPLTLFILLDPSPHFKSTPINPGRLHIDWDLAKIQHKRKLFEKVTSPRWQIACVDVLPADEKNLTGKDTGLTDQKSRKSWTSQARA